MDEPRQGTALTVSVCVTATVAGRFTAVNELEHAIGQATRAAGRQLYRQSLAAFQSAWLAQRQGRFSAQRWRRLQWLTPFGPVELPVRVVREKASGKYFTLSKVLFRSQATRLLSPALEEQAVAQATAQNYRPAARSLSRWIGQPLGHGLVWACVQFYGARRVLELEKLPQPPERPMKVPALISEVDSTWLKAQRRRSRALGGRHFPVYLGLHYTGRVRRYRARDSHSVRLQNKHLLASAAPLAQFGGRFQREGLRHFQAPLHVILSDGDQGLEWMRQRLFPGSLWLLDRWHIAQAVRSFVTHHQAQYRQIMAPVWQADSEAVLEALRQSPLRHQRPQEFQALFGYILGNREGIDAWKNLPPSLRRSTGSTPPVLKCGSGAVEKNIEVSLNRRFKGQGRSWNPQCAEHLLQLKLLSSQPTRWAHWWKTKPKFITKPNPP